MAGGMVGGERVVPGGAGVAGGPQKSDVVTVAWIGSHGLRTQRHIRFDYSREDGMGTACGKRIPPKTKSRLKPIEEVTCDKCMEAWN